ncbi:MULTISPECIES: YebC/PmpR family DNA-binding transcriptional regulator [unclassified Mesotoga]|uniref:Probable transcriptional regulatory protein ENN47_04440 n=3 Tax=Mesotoga TaxID=1184396 RepID=A0A7C1CW13_9BACT|nr:MULTISPECIES: YebC/PmpR family DNA-binding transcriptional regulator [unclassified Mesotoga]MDI9367128.1 YebC/PmpR family DNA-binding transcriptional regulator [Thermotogota bacterium]NLT44514.1 YebC/PmpR family DNA-binding transcriptional regulator [Thermotogaceae bacterium]HDP77431.1 YebC/PmpR family DNA-binding transcriptional regulator [Mesotoga infera]MDD3681709.1 YebC/PmpR family DNA-binding transcriptional regulator [Mesotoga sp.]MDD4207377.1 YebC/PmpR family DNA-binding transcriptio
MSGHNKWANIKHRKGAQDAKRSKVFTKIIRELMVSAREGGSDPNTNTSLRTAIEKARAANMPKDTMEKAIKKGAGELEGQSFSEALYEGYAPGGVALLIRCLTDNKNRTAQEIRHTLSKYGGSMAESGAVSWMFERKGIITVAKEQISDLEEFQLLAIEAGAEDIKDEADPIEIVTSPDSVSDVKTALEENGYSLSYDMSYIPSNTLKVEGSDAGKLFKLLDILEDNDDVQEIYDNSDIDEAEMEALAEQMG